MSGSFDSVAHPLAARVQPAHAAPPNAAHGWGPWVYRVQFRRRDGRWRAGLVTAAAVGVLALARALTPSPAGHGTHEQLGLAPCSFLIMTAYPCPTCGMTTAFAWTVRGHWLRGAQVQPFGFLLSLATMLMLVGGISAALTGQTWTINWLRINPAMLAGGSVALLLAAWAYTILVTVAAQASGR